MLRKGLIGAVALLSLLLVLAWAGRVQADGTPTPEADQMQMEATPDPHSMDMDGTPMPDSMMDMNGHDQSERIAANGAAVKIVAPQAGAVLHDSNAIVRVETVNWPLGEEGRHWHLYVNGKNQGMSQGNSPALQARDLLPGENMIEVVLSNQLHQELDATDKVTVQVVSADQAAAATAAPDPGPSSGVLVTLLLIGVVVVAILGVGFTVTRKKV